MAVFAASDSLLGSAGASKVAPLGVCASPFVLKHNGVLAGVRKNGGDCIFASSAYDGGVNVKVPLIIEDNERAHIRSRIVGAALDLYGGRDTASYRHAVAA